MKQSHRLIGIFAIIATAVLATWGAVSYDWFPLLISETDGKIDALYSALLIASVPVFVGVTAFIGFCLLEFRAKPGDDSDGAPIHGSTSLEFIWTAIPTIIVIVLGIYATVVLADIEKPQKKELEVKVIGEQFAWHFEYPQLGVKSDSLVVPKDRPLHFRMTSLDVIHSFFVPNARLKRDLAAGKITQLRFTPDKTGNFPIICTELCGVGHTTMRGTLSVVTPTAFDAWVAKQKNGGKPAGATGAATGPDGKQVFTDAGCGACHALSTAGTSGAAGPALDRLAGLDPKTVRQSILDPEAIIAKGYTAGIMPATIGKDLPPAELDALVEFLTQAKK